MFTPWIGRRFGDETNMLRGLRLLIVGESHYPGPEKGEKFVGKTYAKQTQETIRADAIEKPYVFFKKFARLATGEDVKGWPSERHGDFWDSVAFYNFVPVFLRSPSDGGRPTTSEWQSGREPFMKVVNELDPQILIVCGLTNWWWVMDSLPGGENANSARRDTARIGNGQGLRVPHVTGSRGEDRYDYEVSRPLLVSLIEASRS